ncbi:MAG: hypothetical protein JRF69_00795 [Deltaproteobacteria bacterium]|nr:hypothetical protein [Deltaproteobacteria bacterium]MBW2259577.1 hypothetical protein [Deltaproteobacteria bacterium]
MGSAVKNPGNRLSKRPFTRVISAAIGLILVVLALVWTRAFFVSMHAYQEGEEYFKKHQHIKAITFFDRSIHWYTPFNPYVHKSAQRLWEICTRAEQQGDIQLALIATRTIRRGFLAARSFYTPGRDWIDRCDAKIASLMDQGSKARRLSDAAAVSSPPQASSEPDVFWTLILEVGFLGWIGSVIAFLMLSLTGGQTARLRSGAAIFWGIMVIIFYAMWIVGMIQA